MYMEKTLCTNPVIGKLIRVKQKNFKFFLNQVISPWKQILMMVEIYTTLVDTVLLTAYQIVQQIPVFVILLYRSRTFTNKLLLLLQQFLDF